MASTSDGSSSMATGTSQSHLASLVPTFDPAKDDMIIYGQKVEIVLAAWPKEKLTELVTRLILNAQGSAFQKLQLHQAELLADNDPKHVRRIVELLGGQWGRIALERQYQDAEQALFHSVQQADESNDSYIARCDILWNRLLARKMSLEDLQSYIVLRGSLLGAEEKKKVILDSDQSLEGRLTIKKVTEAIRVLGASFFGEMTGSRKQIRSKVYDQATLVTEAVEQADGAENAFMSQGTLADQEDEDQIIAEMMREGDLDAALIADFEGAASELLQEDEELASAYNAYEEARRRLTEKYRNRGFWPVNRGQKGKSKGKKRWDGDPAYTPSSKGDSWYDKNTNQRRKSLQDRILQSNCRLCGRRGHWKAECPEKHKTSTSSSGPASTMAPTSLAVIESGPQTSTDQSLPLEFLQLPEMQTLDDARANFGESFVFWCSGDEENNLSVLKHRLREHRERLLLGKTSENCIRSETIRARLASRCRVNFVPPLSRANPTPDTGIQSKTDCQTPEETVCFATHGSLGILDLGASKTVIGSQNVSDFLQHLKPSIREKIHRCPCAITFRFGNQGTLMSKQALVIPIGRMLLKVAVVPGETPFLLSNTLMRALRAQIDCSKHVLKSSMLNQDVKLTLTSRGLFLLDVNELIDASFDSTNSLTKSDKPTETFMAVEKTSENVQPEGVVEKLESLEEKDKEGAGSKKVSEMSVKSSKFPISSSVSVRSLIEKFEGQSDPRHVVVATPSTTPADDAIHGGRSLPPDLRRTAGGSDSIRTSPCRTDVSASMGARPRVGELHHQSLSEQQQDGTPEVSSICGTEDSATRDSPRTSACDPSWSSSGGTTHSAHAERKVKRNTQGQRPHASQQGQGIFRSWCIQDGRTQRRERSQSGAQLQRLRRGRCEFQPIVPGRDYGNSNTELHGRQHASENDHSREGDNGASTSTPRDCPEPGNSAFGETGRQFDRELKDEAMSLQEIIGDTCLADVELTSETPTQWSPDRQKLNSLIRQMTVELERVIDSEIPLGQRATLFEVFCNERSNLTDQVIRCGKIAHRFGLAQGDLKTVEGRLLLFQKLVRDRPRHIWVSPDCGPWSAWTRLNESRSLEQLLHFQSEREKNLYQVALSIVLYRFQKRSRGHFHWEQPAGSSMLSSPLVSEVHEQTKVSQFDMCNAGQLVDPVSKMPMKKGMHVLTSSNQLYETLHGKTCRRNHVHQPIEGTTRTKPGLMLRTKFTENYPRKFARLVAQCICRPSLKDPSLTEDGLTEILAAQHGLPKATAPRQVIRSELIPFEEFRPQIHPTKRRRLAMKQTVEHEDDSHGNGQDIVQKVHQVLPRVGKVLIQDSEIRKELQDLFPEKQIIEVIACRGTDRTIGPPRHVTRETAPYRRSIILHRTDGKVYVERSWECWKELSQRQVIRPAHACRINITVFGVNPSTEAGIQMPKERPAMEIEDSGDARSFVAKSCKGKLVCSKSKHRATIPGNCRRSEDHWPGTIESSHDQFVSCRKKHDHEDTLESWTSIK